MMINVTQYPVAAMPPEERDFLGLMELDQIEPPQTREDAIRFVDGMVYKVVLLDDEFPW
jgi:hypothetical protein